MSTPRHRTDSSTPQQPIPLILITLVLGIGLLVWNELGAIRSMATQQRQVSNLAVNLVSAELDGHLQRTARTNQLFLQDAYTLSQRLQIPGPVLPQRLTALLGDYHDNLLGFVLADNQGDLDHDANGSGEAARWASHLKAFAANMAERAVQLVEDAGTAQLIMMQRINLADDSQWILLTRYNLSHIRALLGRGNVAGSHRMFLQQTTPTDITLSAGAEHRVRGDLSPDERALVADQGATALVPDAPWRVLALPDAKSIAAAHREAWLRVAAIILIGVLFMLFALRRMRSDARRRELAEAALRKAHAELELKVDERTQALTESNNALAAQIARRRKAERRMTMLSRAVEYTGDSIIITDRDGTIAYANPAFARLTGRNSAEVVGTSLADLQTAHQPSEFMRRLWTHLEQENAFRELFCIRNASGEPCYTEQTITPLRNSRGEVTRLIATGKDITERMDSEKRLSFLAHHDTLTGLPNRALMFDRLNHALARGNRKDTMVALLFMDIDRFKTINDSLGHQAGDELLIAVAKRLDASVRRSDSIARLGGDEFVAILEDIHHTEEPVHVANTILAAIAEPLTLAGQEVSVTSSMGIALYPEDGGDANVLLQCADAAMYKAKAQGGNTYNFYTSDMTDEAQRRLRLESRLRNALEKHEFRLLYQPRLSLTTGSITAVEALLRWQPPDGPMLTPADFMTVLEETGLIRKVGEWVLQQTCADFVRVQSAGYQLRMACNLSAKQFGDADLVEMIDRTVLDQAMRPQDLELELTESLLTHDVEHAAEVLAALHDRGVRISVDDFGTGYSSLNYLKRFPIDYLKVDQSFIRDLNDDKDDATIVSAIISLAHSLGLGAVAEGVETRAQLQTLSLLGCDEIQGMLVSEPLAMDALLDWLGNRPTGV